MKLSELPSGCGCCGKPLLAPGCSPVVYRVVIAPHVINQKAINQVAGLALAWGRVDAAGFKLAEALAPDADNGLQTDPALRRVLYLCVDCYSGMHGGDPMCPVDCRPLGAMKAVGDE